MINDLIRLADELDNGGFDKQASKIDRLIKKLAWGEDNEPSYLGMSSERFKDLAVSIYEEHFDETEEGWEPYEEDLEEIVNHISIVPHPDDEDFEPEVDGEFWEKDKYGGWTFTAGRDSDEEPSLNEQIAMKIKDIMPHWDEKKKDSMPTNYDERPLEERAEEAELYLGEKDHEQPIEDNPGHPDYQFPVDDWWNS
jgi:hypothetical protein